MLEALRLWDEGVVLFAADWQWQVHAMLLCVLCWPAL